MIAIDMTRFPPGSKIERRFQRTVIWYPRGERLVVHFTQEPRCPTCGEPWPVRYPERDMRIEFEELGY